MGNGKDERKKAMNTEAIDTLSNPSKHFVLLTELIPDLIIDMRYFGSNNFVGAHIDGYDEPSPILAKEAAQALFAASEDARRSGFLFKIYDAYRPKRAVKHFVRWAKDKNDTKTKTEYYPDIDKSDIIPHGYISPTSSHSRGSAVDLTLVCSDSGKELDMGGPFDFFGVLSHPDYTDISEEQMKNRLLLREIMVSNGFKSIRTEWWHFSLKEEPFPNTYFDFTVSRDSLK